MTSKGVYVVLNKAVTIATAITIIQIKSGATTPLELLRVTLSQKGSTTSAQERIQILRKTGAATVTSFTPLLLDPGDSAAASVGGTAATGITGTAEGSDGDVLVDEGFNVLNGWLWLPTPEERIWVPSAAFIALKFPSAPATQTWSAAIYYREFKG